MISKMYSTFTRTEDFSCSRQRICPLDRAETFFIRGRSEVDFVSELFAVPVMGDSVISLLSAEVAAVTVGSFFSPCQQLRSHCHVVYCYFYRMNQSRILSCTDMCFAAELSCISLSGGMHIRISFSVQISGGCRRFGDGRIDNCPFLQHQAFFLEQFYHL